MYGEKNLISFIKNYQQLGGDIKLLLLPIKLIIFLQQNA